MKHRRGAWSGNDKGNGTSLYCILTFSGQPIVENGHNPDENHVSKTSSSCSSVKGLPPALTLACSSASSLVRATIQASSLDDCMSVKSPRLDEPKCIALTSVAWPSIVSR